MFVRLLVSSIFLAGIAHAQDVGFEQSENFSTEKTEIFATMPSVIGLNSEQVNEQLWKNRKIRYTSASSGFADCNRNSVTAQIPENGKRFYSEKDFALLKYGSFSTIMPDPNAGLDPDHPRDKNRSFERYLEEQDFNLTLVNNGPGGTPQTPAGSCANSIATYKVDPVPGNKMCSGDSVTVEVSYYWHVWDCR